MRNIFFIVLLTSFLTTAGCIAPAPVDRNEEYYRANLKGEVYKNGEWIQNRKLADARMQEIEQERNAKKRADQLQKKLDNRDPRMAKLTQDQAYSSAFRRKGLGTTSGTDSKSYQSYLKGYVPQKNGECGDPGSFQSAGFAKDRVTFDWDEGTSFSILAAGHAHFSRWKNRKGIDVSSSLALIETQMELVSPVLFSKYMARLKIISKKKPGFGTVPTTSRK